MVEAALIVAAIAAAFLAVSLLLPRRQLNRRANQDYRRARGTQHRVQLEQALAAIRWRLAAMRADCKRLDDQIANLLGEESRALDAALAAHLVATRLTEVNGVGRTRAASIRDSVFRGKLTDLHQSHLVSGVGPATQQAISAWVLQMTKTWSHLRSQAFPEKQTIMNRYGAQRQPLMAQRDAIQKQVGELEALERRASTELARLTAVTPAQFRAALRRPGTPAGGSVLAPYVLGLFAPWEAIPPWYADLLRAAEGAAANGPAR